MSDNGPTISISPLPPTQGQPCTITYSGGTNPQTLNITWVPDGAGPGSVTTDANGKVKITIPSNAESMTVGGGGAPAESTSITPA
jgi:hypothetical protein